MRMRKLTGVSREPALHRLSTGRFFGLFAMSLIMDIMLTYGTLARPNPGGSGSVRPFNPSREAFSRAEFSRLKGSRDRSVCGRATVWLKPDTPDDQSIR
jgi:hypothetical protein